MMSDAEHTGSFRHCEYTLDETELVTIDKIINDLLVSHSTVETDHFQRECERQSESLPDRLLHFLQTSSSAPNGLDYFRVGGFEIDQNTIGPSPRNWDVSWSNVTTFREEAFQCLISSAVGRVFGWKTQENGRFVRHVTPNAEDCEKQLGGSSSVELLWHTEEAFHPRRADFVTLMCYRNVEKAATNIAPLKQTSIDPDVMSLLRKERFFITPDDSHQKENNTSQQWYPQDEKFCKIEDWTRQPQKVAVLQGNVANRFIVDQAYMFAHSDDKEGLRALDHFHCALDAACYPVVLNAGDMLIFDNHRVAHGRSIFVPAETTQKRWIRRTNVRSRNKNHGSNFFRIEE